MILTNNNNTSDERWGGGDKAREHTRKRIIKDTGVHTRKQTRHRK